MELHSAFFLVAVTTDEVKANCTS